MSEFRPNGKFYDALSGEFYPPSDKLRRAHTLARLAVGVCEKGEEYKGGLLYYPTWAETSYAAVWQPENRLPSDTQVIIGEAYGRWPLEVGFSHVKTNPAMGPDKDILHITFRNEEENYELEIGEKLLLARQRVTDLSQHFYDTLKTD